MLAYWEHWRACPLVQWRVQGGGSGESRPPIRPDACLILEFLHRQHRISLLKWLIISMKGALNFATKLNSKDIKKNCLGGTQLAIGVHRLRNTWSSL